MEENIKDLTKFERTATITRETKETSITVSIDLDGGLTQIETGVGFFDHMLTAFATHSGFSLKVKTTGDLFVDCHHTVEDTGIVLGQAFKKALGTEPVKRFADAYIPMDESLSFCAVDISSRPYLVFDANFPQSQIGDFDACMVKEFFTAFAFNAGITLHMKNLYGDNSHHIAESLFKAFAYCMKKATRLNEDGRLMSTKGILG
ncbi:MAG: imidazoleglycerol-phosphate dehydratase HisB [Clostridia bacterium]|nr:imidazoleglycerol-phosphate dehydratase HisB [Clostridia bacterium]